MNDVSRDASIDLPEKDSFHLMGRDRWPDDESTDSVPFIFTLMCRDMVYVAHTAKHTVPHTRTHNMLVWRLFNVSEEDTCQVFSHSDYTSLHLAVRSRKLNC